MELKRLAPQFRTLVTPDFLVGGAAIGSELTKHIKDFKHGDDEAPDLDPLSNIVDKAMQKFSESRREESDRWLAPRVHATLRLTRRGASDTGAWSYLAMVPLEAYVRWRWGSDRGVAAERFICGEFNKHAIARLWWGAELTRNGSDYSSTALLFVNQDLQNSWVKTRLFRHRPTALASLHLLSTFNDGQFADSDTIRDLIKSFNMALTTTMLDAVAPSVNVDAQSIRDWCSEEVDETTMFEEMPTGPAEEPIDPAAIDAITDLLKRVVHKTRFSRRKRTKAEPVLVA